MEKSDRVNSLAIFYLLVNRHISFNKTPMAINYTKGLQNIQNRKFDGALNESLTTKSFSSTDIPENIKYLWESMQEIPAKSNAKTIDAGEKVKTHLEQELKLHFNRDYRTQGSVTTKTNIAVHSDYDLLTIVGKYHYVAPPLTVTNPYTESNADTDIKELRSQAETILKKWYDEVEPKGKSIKIFNKALYRYVDVVCGFWNNTIDYEQTGSEVNRGIYLYDFDLKRKKSDYPFSHIYYVNQKGDHTNDGSRKAIRLLKNVKNDSDVKIELSSFALTTIVHSIDNKKLFYTTGSELSITQTISDQLDILINDPSYRSKVQSPNRTEAPLTEDTVPEMQKMKNDLDAILKDSVRELSSPFIKARMLNYL